MKDNDQLWNAIILHWTTYLTKCGDRSYASRVVGVVRESVQFDDEDTTANIDNQDAFDGVIDLPGDDCDDF